MPCLQKITWASAFYVCVRIFQTLELYIVFSPNQQTMLILRNPAKNSMMFRCLCQHRPTLLLLSKILVPEQAEAIFAPLCCEKLNRLNEQAQFKPSHLNGFTCKAIFKTAQHCGPNWLFKSACCLLTLHFTSVYIGCKCT